MTVNYAGGATAGTVVPQAVLENMKAWLLRIPDLEKVFRRLDVNGDGKISPDEAEYLVDTGAIPPGAVDLLFQIADVDHDGYIDLGEFVEYGNLCKEVQQLRASLATEAELTGAGEPAVNGVYIKKHDSRGNPETTPDGKSKWVKKDDPSVQIFFGRVYWRVVCNFASYYHRDAAASRPPATGWESDGLKRPPPQVAWRDGNGPFKQDAAAGVAPEEDGHDGCITQMM